MIWTIVEAPTHPRKQVEGFGKMRQDDQGRAARAEQLEEGGRVPFSEEQHNRSGQQQARRHADSKKHRKAVFLHLVLRVAATRSRQHSGGVNRGRLEIETRRQ